MFGQKNPGGGGHLFLLGTPPVKLLSASFELSLQM